MPYMYVWSSKTFEVNHFLLDSHLAIGQAGLRRNNDRPRWPIYMTTGGGGKENREKETPSQAAAATKPK